MNEKLLSSKTILQTFARVNTIASANDLSSICNGFLDLALEKYDSNSGAIFLFDPLKKQINLQIIKGPITKTENFHEVIKKLTSVSWKLISNSSHNTSSIQLSQMFIGKHQLSYTIQLDQEPPVGVIHIYLDQELIPSEQWLNLLVCRFYSEIKKAQQLEWRQEYNERLLSLINILGKLGSTLDEQEILQMIIHNGRLLTNAEGCSLFLFNETTQENVLKFSSNLSEKISQNELEIRVPAGKGIIGHAVQTGEPLIIEDASQDTRHFQNSDNSIDFQTRSILAVPMQSQSIKLLGIQDDLVEKKIGGIEAINKINGVFNIFDQKILQILANQAAATLEIARAYRTSNETFMDVTRALSAAIDAKDPYTIGHSYRVSEFAAMISEQLSMPDNFIQKIRLGGLLHDIGKIGIPDVILQKPEDLGNKEYQIMKQHPIIGGEIIGKVQKLHDILPGLIEHHEHLDGTGYPNQLKEGQISLFGRIIAVADAFDAITSKRPYREAIPSEAAFKLLKEKAGTHLDATCINALILAYNDGKIKTQFEEIQDKKVSYRDSS